MLNKVQYYLDILLVVNAFVLAGFAQYNRWQGEIVNAIYMALFSIWVLVALIAKNMIFDSRN